MNELIKRLAEQAWDATSVSPEFGHPVSFADRLSELIVKECGNWIVDNAASMEHLGPEYFSKAMKEYFGVEP